MAFWMAKATKPKIRPFCGVLGQMSGAEADDTILETRDDVRQGQHWVPEAGSHLVYRV